MWSLYTGGAYRQAELIDRRSLYTGGAYIPVELICDICCVGVHLVPDSVIG